MGTRTGKSTPGPGPESGETRKQPARISPAGERGRQSGSRPASAARRPHLCRTSDRNAETPATRYHNDRKTFFCLLDRYSIPYERAAGFVHLLAFSSGAEITVNCEEFPFNLVAKN